MVKPADNSGSRGIVKVEDKKDREAVAKAYAYSRESSRSGDVVVEEYMQGPEVSVETLTVNGECHVIQMVGEHSDLAGQIFDHAHGQRGIGGKLLRHQFPVNGHKQTGGEGSCGRHAGKAVKESGFAQQTARFVDS